MEGRQNLFLRRRSSILLYTAFIHCWLLLLSCLITNYISSRLPVTNSFQWDHHCHRGTKPTSYRIPYYHGRIDTNDHCYQKRSERRTNRDQPGTQQSLSPMVTIASSTTTRLSLSSDGTSTSSATNTNELVRVSFRLFCCSILVRIETKISCKFLLISWL
jgi:hypothetical protein